jgi:hypothetical protein
LERGAKNYYTIRMRMRIMSKRNYVEAVLNVIQFEVEDVIATSGSPEAPSLGPDDTEIL